MSDRNILRRQDFRQAIRTYKERGLATFLKVIVLFAWHRLKDTYWNFKGKITVNCSGLDAFFDSRFGSHYRKITSRFLQEKDILEDLIRELNQDDVYYDVGAGLGLHTCLPAKKNNAGKVISIEPYPPNFNQLEKNVSLNELENTEMLNLALSDSKGSEYFNEQTNSLDSEDSNYEVKTAIGDNLISERKMPLPNVIKIDVEGSEPLVVKGLQSTLKNDQCRLLYCEVHLPAADRPSIEDFGMDYEAFRKVLENYGFELTVMKKRVREVFIKGEKADKPR